MQNEGQGEMEVVKKGTSESVFQWLYMALKLNLMCHVDNTKHSKDTYLIWHEDALSIVFACMKNDQEGTLLMDPNGLLSPDSDQGDQFLKEFETLLDENEEEIHQMGYDLEDLGSHSICKGTIAYIRSDATASPAGGDSPHLLNWLGLPIPQPSVAVLSKGVKWLLPNNDTTYCYLQCANGIPLHGPTMSKLEELTENIDLFLPTIAACY
eukprot:13857758-Ditylum_brightwellii.AAC.1